MTCPKSLYKFVAPDRIDILETGFIRFTQPSALNDPFELQPVFENLLTEEQLQEAANPPFDMVEKEIRRHYVTLTPEQQAVLSVEDLLELLKTNPLILEQLIAQIAPTLRAGVQAFTPQAKVMLTEVLQNKFGILSLSEDANQPLLWAHYSDAHRGFAIEFDTEHPYFHRRRSESDELYYLRKVQYVHRNAGGRALLDLDGDDLLVTKAPSWEYETEWRMLVPLEDANHVLHIGGDTIHLFALPLSAISRIIFGARSTKVVHERVGAALARPETNHIRFAVATLDTTEQSIKVSPL